MRVYNKKFVEFLEGNDKHFVIPVYQRNYDWSKDHCKRLFDDILEIHLKGYNNHFLGTIVSIYDEQSEKREYLIIDGQQRITTLSLLLLALYDLLDKEEIKSTLNKEEIRDEYLVNKYSDGDKRIRLKPVKDDNLAFVQLFKEHDTHIPDSNVTNNYNYFKERIKKLNISVEDFYRAVKRLIIVEIELIRSEDDPQMIFESLNSTGLSLTQSDLVRNFILMKQPTKEQEQFYNQYWYKIEKNTKFNVDSFIRDFLTYKERVIPNKDKVYDSFKKFVRQNHPEDIENFLKELLKFSTYYNKIAFSREENEDINNLLKRINKLEVSVSYPFLLEVFDDYNEGILKKEDVVGILKILESFAFRRLITDLPTNALNKIFQILGRDIKKVDNYKENYIEILKYLLINKKGSQKFPIDSDFCDRFKSRDVYNLKSKNRLHLLESLENYENKEEVKVEELLNDKTLNIEHIMPQTLTKSWINSLGQEFHQIHEKWLHTIGNITLTGYNSKMSNKSFLEKRDMEKGFKQSRLFLNKYLSDLDEWNEENIKKRSEILCEIALKIWPYPKTDYKLPKKTENLYSLSEDRSFTGEKIESYIFQEKEIKVKSWKELYQNICLSLYDMDSNKFKLFLGDDEFQMKKRKMISSNKEDLKNPLKISDTIYLESNLNTDTILNMIKLILGKFEIEDDEISIYLRENDVSE
jgi:uncharacterized protein with ParB-like and HNH nuclease domain